MIRLIMISSLAFLVSCAAWKERRAEKNAIKAPVETVESAEPQLEPRPDKGDEMIEVQGVVRLNRPGCPVSIDMTNGDLFSTVYPVNLDKQYMKEGLKLKFNFAPSRAPSPESCAVDMVVSLSNVVIIK